MIDQEKILNGEICHNRKVVSLLPIWNNFLIDKWKEQENCKVETKWANYQANWLDTIFPSKSEIFYRCVVNTGH